MKKDKFTEEMDKIVKQIEAEKTRLNNLTEKNEEELRIKLNLLKEDVKRKRFEDRVNLMVRTTLVTSVLFITLFSILLLVNPEDREELLLWPFRSSISLDKSRIVSLELQVSDLKNETHNIKNDVDNLKSFSSDDQIFFALNEKLKKHDIEISNINETVTEKPDTAITAKLLREKQLVLDQKLDSLMSSQKRVEDKVDGFLSNAIAVPLYGAFAGITFTLITTLVAPLLVKFKENFLGSPNTTPSNDK